MTLKTVLVPLLGSEDDAQALASAVAIARGFNAHIDGLYVRVDPRDTVPLLGEGLAAGMVEEIMRVAEEDARRQAQRLQQLFTETMTAAGIALCTAPPAHAQTTAVSARWRERVGREEEVVTSEGRLYDLLVFPHSAMDRHQPAYVTLETALMGAARPLLLSPSQPHATIGERVVLAWNGGQESTRALVGALPFLRRAKTIYIITAHTSVTDADTADRLAEYFAWQGIACEIAKIKPGTEAVGAALLTHAQELATDLVVMGGYGHSRMRELILGGVTRHVLAHARLPVLMAH